MKIVAAKKILKANDQLASENRVCAWRPRNLLHKPGWIARLRQDNFAGRSVYVAGLKGFAIGDRRRYCRPGGRRANGETRRSGCSD